MARYTKASCRLCRREGTKLFLKGKRCDSEKCAFTKRAYAPGQHGAAKQKLSNYGIQLREKQKLKRMYGLMEKQFRHYFELASKSKGVTGRVLLQLLESRLDNVVYRLCVSPSRAQARQIVRHGFIYVNGGRVDIPSYFVKANDTVELKIKKETFINKIKENIDSLKDKSIPEWLKFDQVNLKGTVVRLPEKEDIQQPIQEQLIVELYSK